MQLDPDYIPSPTMNDWLSSRFHILITMNIAYEFGFIFMLMLCLTELLQLLSGP